MQLQVANSSTRCRLMVGLKWKLNPIVLVVLIFARRIRSVSWGRRAGGTGGYRLAEMVWYLAMTETIPLSSSRVFVEINEVVKAGDLAYTLAHPPSYPCILCGTFCPKGAISYSFSAEK